MLTKGTRSHIGYIFCLAEYTDESGGRRILVSGGGEGVIKFWDTATNLCLFSLQAHFAAVTALCIGNQVLYSSSCDGTVRVWDLKSKACRRTLKDAQGQVLCLELSENHLFTGDSRGKVHVYGRGVYQVVYELTTCSVVHALTLSHDQKELYVATHEGVVLCYSLPREFARARSQSFVHQQEELATSSETLLAMLEEFVSFPSVSSDVNLHDYVWETARWCLKMFEEFGFQVKDLISQRDEKTNKFSLPMVMAKVRDNFVCLVCSIRVYRYI